MFYLINCFPILFYRIYFLGYSTETHDIAQSKSAYTHSTNKASVPNGVKASYSQKSNFGHPCVSSRENIPNQHISYHSTEKLKLNLSVFRDTDHQEPLYLVSNSSQNSHLYRTYKQRMQIEECFRDIKILFGFRYLRLKRQELPRIALLWFIVCVSYGICFLHLEKSGEWWLKTYHTYRTKTYPLIFVIKSIREIPW